MHLHTFTFHPRSLYIFLFRFDGKRNLIEGKEDNTIEDKPSSKKKHKTKTRSIHQRFRIELQSLCRVVKLTSQKKQQHIKTYN